MSTVYLFSGLGADKRAFQELDFGGVSTIHIPWLASHQKESLPEYAKRLAKQIKENNPIFIGLSFGGMVAVEVNQGFPCTLIHRFKFLYGKTNSEMGRYTYINQIKAANIYETFKRRYHKA